MISSYYRSAQGALLVFDNSNARSFHSVKGWLKEVSQFAPADVVKYLVCNKVDLAPGETMTSSSSQWQITDEVNSPDKYSVL